MAKHVYRQWQWDHDRPAYEEAVAASDRQMQKSREKSRTTPGKVVSLSELRRRHLFKDWENYVSAGILRRCRRLFRETVDELVVLGPRPKRSVVLEILRRCTEQLNELDEAHDGFIETQEREDLCRLIDELGAAVGVRDKMPLADQWREW